MNNSITNQNSKTFYTQKLVLLSLMCAIAYISTVFIHVPVVSFLTYDPKDVIIVITGFIFSPIQSIIVSVIVSLVEMVTISDTGPIGLIMNVFASCIFSLIASIFYHKKNTNKSIITGLIISSISMTSFMLIWNFLITPFYLGIPRSAVIDMLIPVILPFNLIKCILNSCIILLIYKPIIKSLQKNKIISSTNNSSNSKSHNIPIFIIAILLLLTCIFIILVLNNVI